MCRLTPCRYGPDSGGDYKITCPDGKERKYFQAADLAQPSKKGTKSTMLGGGSPTQAGARAGGGPGSPGGRPLPGSPGSPGAGGAAAGAPPAVAIPALPMHRRYAWDLERPLAVPRTPRTPRGIGTAPLSPRWYTDDDGTYLLSCVLCRRPSTETQVRGGRFVDDRCACFVNLKLQGTYNGAWTLASRTADPVDTLRDTYTLGGAEATRYRPRKLRFEETMAAIKAGLDPKAPDAVARVHRFHNEKQPGYGRSKPLPGFVVAGDGPLAGAGAAGAASGDGDSGPKAPVAFAASWNFERVFAREYGGTPCLALLLRRGADPNARNRAGQTSLHLACEAGHAAAVATLCETGGADGNLADPDGT